jgi:hypothetical protein
MTKRGRRAGRVGIRAEGGLQTRCWRGHELRGRGHASGDTYTGARSGAGGIVYALNGAVPEESLVFVGLAAYHTGQGNRAIMGG